MENKNTLIVIIIMCLISLRLSAQPPSWQVNENEFEYTMTMVAFLNVNATKLSDTNDMIGAFVGNECRGVANLIYAASTDNYFAYLTVFSNSTSENVTFKIYDSNNNTITIADQTFPFEINKHYGSIESDFGISKPTPRYFKKNVLTCDTSKGAIMVMFEQDNVSLTLEKDNQILTANTSEEKAQFENLEMGTYVLKINDSFQKTITIELEN
jgi:hypothetical protein